MSLFRRTKHAEPGVAPLEDTTTQARDSDPRRAPIHMPIALPPPGQFYPTDGIPYPNPDNPPTPPVVVPPVIVSLNPTTATVGDPDFTLHVLGTGFKADDVLMWNGAPEATTFVSDTELTTGVTMSLVSVGSVCMIAVQPAIGPPSAPVEFVIHDAPPAP